MTIIARFTPQAWMRDNAIEIDADGPQVWDATAFWEELDPAYRRGLQESLDSYGEALDVADCFKDDPAAPEWVRRHSGPFEIHLMRGDDPDHPVEDWQYEVANGDTRLGYQEWLSRQREMT